MFKLFSIYPALDERRDVPAAGPEAAKRRNRHLKRNDLKDGANIKNATPHSL